MASKVNYRLGFLPVDDFVALQIFEGAMILNDTHCDSSMYSSVFSSGYSGSSPVTVGFQGNRPPGVFAGNDLRYAEKLSNILGINVTGAGFETLYNALSKIAYRNGCNAEISRVIAWDKECIGTKSFTDSCRNDRGFAERNGMALQIFKIFRYISVPVFGAKYFSRQVTTYVDPEAFLLFLTGFGMSAVSFTIRTGEKNTRYLVTVNVSPSVLYEFWEGGMSYMQYYKAKGVDMTSFRFPVLLSVRDATRDLNAYLHEAVELYVALQQYPTTVGGGFYNLLDNLSLFIIEERGKDFVEVGNFKLTVTNALSSLKPSDRAQIQKLLMKAKSLLKRGNYADYINIVKLAYRFVFLHDYEAYYSLARTVDGMK
ncbi:MAG: hypothetical protein ACP5GH_06745 [Nitrososphaeria archaeon]